MIESRNQDYPLSTSLPQQNSIVAVCFRLLLAVSLWQGPVLWGHQHEPNSAGLAAHLSRFHADDSHALTLGWHWHLSLPVQRVPGSSDDAEQSQQPLPLIVVSSASLCANISYSSSEPTAFAALTPTALIDSGLEASRTGTCGFLATYCPAHSPQQLFCRLSC